MSNPEIFRYAEFQIEYRCFGTGNEVIFAFHGFGRQAEDFAIFEALLKPHQKIVSLALFQHESSIFPPARIPSKPLQIDEFSACIQALMAFFKVQKIGLLGYSLGGKICLCLLQSMPEKINFVMLFAPDGLRINPLYKFSSKTLLGRSLYKAVLHYPAPFFGFSNFAHRSKIISPQVHRFVHHHMDTFKKRKLVYDTWLIYRDFEPNHSKIRAVADQYGISLHLFFGRYDKIIPPEHGYLLCRNWRENAIHVLENGHLLLNGSTLRYLRDNQLWP